MRTYFTGSSVKGDTYIVCLICGSKSFNPNDVAHAYCGSCHIFHPEQPPMCPISEATATAVVTFLESLPQEQRKSAIAAVIHSAFLKTTSVQVNALQRVLTMYSELLIDCEEAIGPNRSALMRHEIEKFNVKHPTKAVYLPGKKPVRNTPPTC